MAKIKKITELDELEEEFDLDFEDDYLEELDDYDDAEDEDFESDDTDESGEELAEEESDEPNKQTEDEADFVADDELEEDDETVFDEEQEASLTESNAVPTKSMGIMNMDAAYEDPETKAKWYVVHTYSGHENKVKVNIEKIVENRGMQDLVLDIVVPTEDVVEMKNGQRKVKTRKMFPGYVIVKMIVTNESWYLVRNTQGVTGFVGHGSEPIPLTNEEVRRMGIEKVYIDLDIDVGDNVKVINGPFENFMGIVEEVNMDKQILKVKISMFGRDTPVELEFGQVDKI